MRIIYIIILLNISLSTFGMTLEFMSYNVENLFDTIHDKDKNDWSYLPKNTPGKKKACQKMRSSYYKKKCLKSDWTVKKLNLKISQIKDVLLKERKRLPDFLALSEVENERVVSKLAKALGYPNLLISSGADKRGIKLALLYLNNKKVKFIKKKEHQLEHLYFKKKPTRNIFEVEFLINNKAFTLFINHWPSLSNPTKARVIAANVLKNRIDRILLKNSQHGIIALGDFNTIAKDNPHPFDSVLTKEGVMIDLGEAFLKDRSISKEQKESMPPGTYFYTRESVWNNLDRVFVSANFFDKKESEVIVSSFQIYAPDFTTGAYEYQKKKHPLFGTRVVGIPKKYNFNATKKSRAGYSDHFSLVFKASF